MTAEERVAAGEAWFAEIRKVPAAPFPTYVEPTTPPPYDMTTAAGTFTHGEALSQRRCGNCQRPIPVGIQHVSHHLWATSHVTNHYHEECVILP